MTATAGRSPTSDQSDGRNQRERILDIALGLMSEHGADNTSMRRLANACGVHVAALYHYFPSKADLLRSVISERQYDILLAEPPTVDLAQPVGERMATLLEALWRGALHEQQVWRLLVGESSRGNADAISVGNELLATIQNGLTGWVAHAFPENDNPEALAEALVAHLFGLVIESPFTEPEVQLRQANERGRRLANLAFGSIDTNQREPLPH